MLDQTYLATFSIIYYESDKKKLLQIFYLVNLEYRPRLVLSDESQTKSNTFKL